ncbi:MAG: Fimbrial assembly family protein [Patescibacteria group bacterium]|nr:Fimbrial assembly family protein [Patescibacteria group bacterium]
MINLLPPPMKEQIRYAKLNRLVLRYLRVVILVVVVLAGVFAGTFYLQEQQTVAVVADVAEKQQTIASLNKTFTPKAKEVSDRLNAITYVQSSQTHFSALVADIAKVVPRGVSIDSLTLTGNDKVPVKIAVTALSYEGALSLRNALITSPRVAGADLETITSNGSGAYQTSIVVAFKPGQAK